jgi:transcriptional regulator with XRE-family HTH domain
MARTRSGYGHRTRKPHPVDVYVGARVRQRRTLLGMTQTDLGEAIGLSYQQVQKYEIGTNRIGASRLYDLSRILDVSIEYFFDDMPPKVSASSPGKGRGTMKGLPSFDLNLLTKRETLAFVRAYYKIEDADARKRVYELTKALGAAGG